MESLGSRPPSADWGWRSCWSLDHGLYLSTQSLHRMEYTTRPPTCRDPLHMAPGFLPLWGQFPRRCPPLPQPQQTKARLPAAAVGDLAGHSATGCCLKRLITASSSRTRLVVKPTTAVTHRWFLLAALSHQADMRYQLGNGHFQAKGPSPSYQLWLSANAFSSQHCWLIGETSLAPIFSGLLSASRHKRLAPAIPLRSCALVLGCLLSPWSCTLVSWAVSSNRYPLSKSSVLKYSLPARASSDSSMRGRGYPSCMVTLFSLW